MVLFYKLMYKLIPNISIIILYENNELSTIFNMSALLETDLSGLP